MNSIGTVCKHAHTHTHEDTQKHTGRTAAGARPLRNSDVTERMKELVCVVMNLYM